MSDSLRTYRLQHTRPPSLSPTPGVCSNLCPSSQWCHPTISSSVIPFSSCLQSCPASSGQSIGVSASASVLPMSIQDWFPLRLTDLISLRSKGLSIYTTLKDTVKLSDVLIPRITLICRSASTNAYPLVIQILLIQAMLPYMMPLAETVSSSKWNQVQSSLSLHNSFILEKPVY